MSIAPHFSPCSKGHYRLESVYLSLSMLRCLLIIAYINVTAYYCLLQKGLLITTYIGALIFLLPMLKGLPNYYLRISPRNYIYEYRLGTTDMNIAVRMHMNITSRVHA